jgi:hypothetical protein
MPNEEVENSIELKGKKINLTKLGINFTLNDQQITALNKIVDFIVDRNDLQFTLMGYGGTGKSSIVKILLKWIDDYFRFFDIEITAPTHRAKFIIESLSGSKSKTIHSILGLMPNVNIEKLDHRSLQFDKKKEPQIPKNLLIIDESSMINDFLYQLIIEKCKYKDCQVLFIGDPAQLKPVKQTTISKVFQINNKYELTKVERQKDGNPLLGILTDIRENPFSEAQLFAFEDQLNSKNEGLLCYSSSKDFLEKCVPELTKTLDNNFLHARILAFTNDRIALYNKLIRKKLEFDDEYVKGELLMSYANLGEDYVNSCDYIIDSKPLKLNRHIGSISVIGWAVDLMSTDEKRYMNQFIVSKENPDNIITKIGEEIEHLRFAAINAKERQERMAAWRRYYEAIEAFISPMDIIFEGRVVKTKSVDYGYAHTIHKSQGGTYTNVFVDYRDIQICKFDVQQMNQLKYVAFSRATNQVSIFH